MKALCCIKFSSRPYFVENTEFCVLCVLFLLKAWPFSTLELQSLMNVKSPEDSPENYPLDLQMGKTEGEKDNIIPKTSTDFKELKHTAANCTRVQTL